MAVSVNLKHETGVVKQAPVGFSWTTLFFGGFPALLRGDVKWFLLGWLISLATVGFGLIIMAFIYNKIYVKDLMEKGYRPADDFSKNILAQKGILAAS